MSLQAEAVLVDTKKNIYIYEQYDIGSIKTLAGFPFVYADSKHLKSVFNDLDGAGQIYFGGESEGSIQGNV